MPTRSISSEQAGSSSGGPLRLACDLDQNQTTCDDAMWDAVHFEGRWTEEELGAVSAVIRRTEARLEAPPSPSSGKPWVCLREEIDDVRVLYVATRYGFHATLKALTAAALAERVEEFADVAVPYADPR